jgi:hypothetical protein
MKKPNIYFDTSVISAFWYEGGDVAMLARRLRTREWWEFERGHFHSRASEFCEAGIFPRQPECLKMVRRIRYLRVTSAVHALADAILANRLVPNNKIADAGHLAISAVHGVDYLLTWNYSHMANPIVQSKFDALCDEMNLNSSLLVSPESVPQIRFGQSILRRRRR